MRNAIFTLALLACSNGTPSTAKQDPARGAASTPSQGAVVSATFDSKALGVSKRVVVYLPAGYQTSGKRYPVFYYLHGLGGDESNWVDGGHIDDSANAIGLDAILVMPDGDDGFYVDSPKQVDYAACMKDGSGLFFAERPRDATCVHASKYETYIVDDLVSWVDATYRTLATREGRAIAGLSMGGFGALQLALRHPDRFIAAASHSGVDALLYGGPIPYAKGKVTLVSDIATWGAALGTIGDWMRTIFGPDLATWQSYDPAALAAKLGPTGAPALYLDCGTEDQFLLHNGMQYLHDLLLERKIAHEYYIGPGAHDFAFWAARVKYSLAFLRSKTARPS